jgi:hypothetical protein
MGDGERVNPIAVISVPQPEFRGDTVVFDEVELDD